MLDIWKALIAAAEAGESVALVTVVGVNGSAPRNAGARMLVWPEGRILGTIGGGNLEFQAIQQAQAALKLGQPRRFAVHLTRDLGMCCGGAMELYIEPQNPEERLILYGAGHVAQATARIAGMLGYKLTVVDNREEWNTVERFPDAIRVDGDARTHARALQPDARTAVLIVSHEHALDQDILEILLPKTKGWLGLIGSKSKVAKFFFRLRAAGMDPALFERVHGPVGLDISAVTPEEIAVSICAELIQYRRGGGTGASLRYHQESK